MSERQVLAKIDGMIRTLEALLDIERGSAGYYQDDVLHALCGANLHLADARNLVRADD